MKKKQHKTKPAEFSSTLFPQFLTNQTEEQKIEIRYLELKWIWPKKAEEDEEIEGEGETREFMLVGTGSETPLYPQNPSECLLTAVTAWLHCRRFGEYRFWNPNFELALPTCLNAGPHDI